MTERLKKQIQDYFATNPPGWCWQAKAEGLAESVLVAKANFCVELGVFGGRSLIPIGLALQSRGEGIVWGIDAWSKEAALAHLDPVKDVAHITWWSNVDMLGVELAARKAARDLGLDQRILIQRAESSKVPFPFPACIDVLHIDGCHTEEVALDDVQRWLPRCRSGAHVWMDDTNWASTQKAVQLLEKLCTPSVTLPDPATGSECRLFIKL